MGGVNIPLPALDVKPWADPLQEYLRSAQLQQQLAASKQQMQQQAQAFPVAQQQAQANLQATQQENQARQQALKDQQIFSSIANDHIKRDDNGKVTGFDYDAAFNDALARGASPAFVQSQRASHAATAEKYANLDKAARDKEASNNSWLFQTIEGLKGVSDPNQRQMSYQQAVQAAQKRGLDVSQFPPQAPTNDELTALEAPLGMHAEVLKNAETQAKTAKDIAEAGGPAGEREFQTYYKNKLAATGQQPNAALEFQTRHEYALLHRAPRNDEATQQAIEAAAQSIASMDPKDLTRLKDIASMRGDQRLLIFNRAKQINPNFSTAEVDRKVKMLDSFTNGKDGQQLQSFGTFLEHAGEASRVVNDFRTTSIPLVNTPLNKIRDKFGDASYTQMISSLEPVRKEFEGFLLGGRALYGDDRKAAETILNDNSSPAQIQSALKQMGHTVKARQNEMNARFKNTMHADMEDVLGPMSDEAMEGARQIGVDMGHGKTSRGGIVTMRAPNGKTKQVPADQVDHYKQLGATVVNQ